MQKEFEDWFLKVPNRREAFIDPEKLRDYLLAPSHPVGRFKAQYFRSLGYTRASWKKLSADLIAMLENEVREARETSFGCKYRVDGLLRGPAAVAGEITTIWIILNGEHVPRFITAYPRRKRWN